MIVEEKAGITVTDSVSGHHHHCTPLPGRAIAPVLATCVRLFSEAGGRSSSTPDALTAHGWNGSPVSLDLRWLSPREARRRWACGPQKSSGSQSFGTPN